MLIPIVTTMGQELLAGNYIQADETPVPVQMHDGRGKKNHQAYLWQYGRPGGSTIFEFRLGRDREGPKQFLETLKESSKAMDTPPTTRWEAPKSCMRRVWAHARRKFIDAVKLNALKNRLGSWKRWTTSSESIGWRATKRV